MMKQLFFAGLLLAAGMFLVLSDFLKLPTLKAAKAMLGAGKESKKAAKTVEAWLMSGAVKLARHIRMDEYKRARMANVLKAAGYSMTPEVYTAYALTKSGAILLGVIPCLLLLPLLTPLVVILAVLSYFKETRKADEQLKAKRDQIEGELPRFVATVEQSLKASRDVLAMLEAYKKNAGPAFANELDVLTADMRSSSYEAALTRFEARFNSPMLSDVVRGLIGVLRGDDSAVYFQMLSHDFKALELQCLKGRAQKIPPKIRVFSFVMLMCFLLTYMVIIAVQIMKRIISVLLAFVLMISIFLPMNAYAIGDGNVDGGGGGMGDGTNTDFWNTGDEGVRVTVIRASDHAVVTTPIDLTNRTPANSIIHFGKVSKMQYKNGRALSPVQGAYYYTNPSQALPKIISTSGGNGNIAAIKSYFTDEQVIRSIANLTGMNFNVLINGQYKLLLEPIAYMT